MKNTIHITLSDELLDEITRAVREAVREQLPKIRENIKPEWLSTEEVMEMINVSRRTLQNYRDEGKISYFQEGRKILYPKKDVEAFLRKNMIKAYR